MCMCIYMCIRTSPQALLRAGGGGARRGAWGSHKRLYKAPTDNTKPRQTKLSPDRQYKAPTDNTKPRQTILSPNRLY